MARGIVLILSGGLDSTVLAYELRWRGYDLYLLSFNYGQRHLKELDAAKVIANDLGLLHKIVDLADLGRLLCSSLTRHTDVPTHVAFDSPIQRQTIVPNRNAIMLSIAVGIARSVGADAVAYGAHAGDFAVYPDCRPDFIRAIEKAFNIGGGDAKQIELLVPFLEMEKSAIVRRGHELQVPFSDTWTCYMGREKHCGVCGACDERMAAFAEAGLVDPVEYE